VYGLDLFAFPHQTGRAKGVLMHVTARVVAASLVTLVLFVAWPGAQDAPVAAPIRGFSPSGAAAQRTLERRLRELPRVESIKAWHRYFTAQPHPATSPRTREIANYIAAQWKAQGLDEVVIRRYDVLSSNPRRVRAELVAPTRYVPTLREDPVAEDSDSSHRDISGAWLSFSASGDVTAPVVYANSGNPADYDVLRKHGIDPKGKIVIVRYSNPYSYRGFKALTAEREGAAAMIVYSDPQEDGYTRGEVFPKGPWGPASHLQRGGIAYDFIVPGDPQTPGWASTAGAPRVPIGEAVSVPKVMALPMSHRDIQPILEKLGGPLAPAEWKGALPIEYRLGGDAARLRLQIDMRTDVQPNYVVEGRIRGSELPDEWVVLGNHHDAWVFGGVDPSSGTASMMELTKSLGRLKQEGARPKRTLVFCSWDGEEVTLTGSTEWGEQFASELRQKAVAYLNVDSAASGPRLELSAVGSLAPMVVDLTKELRDPSGASLYEAWRRPTGEGDGPKDGALPDQALAVTRIGSGSDHTVFINHVGLPVVEMGFDGPYGVYHSAYDSHYWVDKIGDPGFRYHRLMTELWGAMALRLANAEILPFDVESYAGSVRDFVRRLEDIPGVSDRLEIARLVKAVRALRTAGRRFNARLETALAANPLPREVAARVNRRLLLFEQQWLHEEGIPGRPWFKHLLYAPRYTYAAMTLPGITEAAEQGDWARAAVQLSRVAEAIDRNTALTEGVTAELPASPATSTLESRLRQVRDKVDGRMAVYVENIATGERVAIDADSSYETFSVIKVPLMATVLERVREGRLSLSDRSPLSADQRRIPSGVLYALDPGLAPTVKDLLTLMIIISDNQATDALGDLVGRDEVTRFMARLGLSNTVLRFSDLEWDRLWLSQLDPSYRDASGDRTIDFPFAKYGDAAVREAFRHVIEDTGLFFGRSTARDMGQLFVLMAKGELVSKDASALMVSILKRQQVNNRFPRYLGADVEIAHKTGDGQPWVANDAGILWVKGTPIVLVAFAGHHRGTTEELHDAQGRLAAIVADYFGGTVDASALRTAGRR
jgi:N-acetylated-alpha-linked acidic dipeptidase